MQESPYFPPYYQYFGNSNRYAAKVILTVPCPGVLNPRGFSVEPARRVSCDEARSKCQKLATSKS
jgi:hypothetical protein